MNSRKTMRIALFASLPVLVLTFTAASGGHSALPGSPQTVTAGTHSLTVGGSISTNLGVIDANTTLGTATGDLRGALAAKIAGISQVGNNTVFSVQHHWVLESGETLMIDSPATATSTQVAPGLFAITNYSLHISNGTGKFAGATGDLHLIGEVNLNTGQTVFRYTGQVCFAEPD